MLDPICLAHSTRWMIDQILGREFSDSAASSRASRDYFWPRKIKDIQETKMRRKKANSLYKDLNSVQAQEKTSHTAEAVRSHLAKKFAQKIDVEADFAGVTVLNGLDAIPRLLLSGEGCAYMISLRTESVQDAGVNIKTYNHTLAAYYRYRAGKTSGQHLISFFDPNMGEVKVPGEAFKYWLSVYHSEWKNYEKMQHVNRIYCFRVWAPNDVGSYVKSVKKDAAKKLEQELAILSEKMSFDFDFDLDVKPRLSRGELDAMGTVTEDDDDILNFKFEMPIFDM